MPWRDAPAVSNWQQAPEIEEPEQSTSRLGSALTGFGQGLSLGFSDEAAAGLGATVKRPFSDKSWRDLYQSQLEKERSNLATAREENPILTDAGEIAGAVATGARAAWRGATLIGKSITIPGAIGYAAREGAAYGGLYGAGSAEEGDRLAGAARGAATGALVGGVMGGASGAMAARKKPIIPEVEQLRNQAQSAYKAAEDSGVVISPERYQKFVGDVFRTMKREGIDKTLHPDATAALKRIVGTDGPVTLQQADTLRQVVGDATQSASARDRRLAHAMMRKLDDFVNNLTPSDVNAGDPRAASQALRTARDLWTRKSKGEVFENIMERAEIRSHQFSGSGMENAIRTEFRQLAMNKNRMRQFNQAERDAIKRVAAGGPMENILRQIGKLAPTGIVSGALGGGAGYALGGPIGAAGVMVTGATARGLATMATTRNARLASELARAGAGQSRLPIAAQNVAGAISGAQPILRREDNQ